MKRARLPEAAASNPNPRGGARPRCAPPPQRVLGKQLAQILVQLLQPICCGVQAGIMGKVRNSLVGQVMCFIKDEDFRFWNKLTKPSLFDR